jgi:hypothetical protein
MTGDVLFDSRNSGNREIADAAKDGQREKARKVADFCWKISFAHLIDLGGQSSRLRLGAARVLA